MEFNLGETDDVSKIVEKLIMEGILKSDRICQALTQTIKYDDEGVASEDKSILLKYTKGGIENYVPIKMLIDSVKEMIETLPIDSEERKRGEMFLKSRNLDTFSTVLGGMTNKKFKGEGYGENGKTVRFAIKKLSSPGFVDDFEKMQNGGKEGKVKAYLQKIFELICETKSKAGTLLIEDFDVGDINQILQNYEKIQKIIENGKGSYMYAVIADMQEASNEELESSSAKHIGSYEIKKERNDVEWDVNKELKEIVYSGIPKNASPEEKAIYIYEKMCQILSYDEGYLYRDKGVENRLYKGFFDKEHLESIKVGTKITCFDFSRIYKKLIDGLNDELNAEILRPGFGGHYCIGISTARCSAKLEAANFFKGKDERMPFNDIARAKMGKKLQGIAIISDKYGVIESARENIDPMFEKKEEKTVSELVKQLKNIDEPTTPRDTKEYLKIILSNMGFSGNEFTAAFRAKIDEFIDLGILGPNTKKSYIGHSELDEKNKKIYRRFIWIRDVKGDIVESFLIDTDNLTIEDCEDEIMKAKLMSGEFVYEDDKRTMPGFEEKEVI